MLRYGFELLFDTQMFLTRAHGKKVTCIQLIFEALPILTKMARVFEAVALFADLRAGVGSSTSYGAGGSALGG